jgi:dTDP-4-dehydrorhamnose reductase
VTTATRNAAPPHKAGSTNLEVWGGIECTVNRVRGEYFSQMHRSGHAARIEDLDRAAALGIKALRYPVLWELVAPNDIAHAQWSWPDERLKRLRQLGVKPIVGLVHHGSGPAHTSLVDPAFPEKLAVYAAAVARRYPWVEYYTPVNEPLTTARFSGLYGFWHPHGRDERTFKDALLGQCRAIVLAMRAIRQVNPDAKLVQTEDLGKTYSTPLLAYQAAHNNEMRWLSWDLLCGRVDTGHPIWNWLTNTCGATRAELAWFLENTCPPDIIGANYYITSERFIDENLADYPARYHGGNGRHRYADIEAARALCTSTGGISALLQEAWQRYQLPLAVTEVHMDTTRDDQLRWLAEMWRGTVAAKNAGADVRALTVWALLGSYDWNCLVTECRGYYEPGPFDVRGPRPRATAVAALTRELATGVTPQHPVHAGPGWWKRPQRFFCPPVSLRDCGGDSMEAVAERQPPVLITGATGTLGNAFARTCEQRGLAFRLLNRNEMDIADESSVERALARYEPWAIVNAAGYVRVDHAEHDVDRCFRENTLGPKTLAALCARHKVGLVTFSSDLVFDGRRQSPYVETDAVAPLNVYGRSKAEAEQYVLDTHPASLVVRTSAFFGPWDSYNFIAVLLRTLREGRPFNAASDMTVTPTYVPDLAHACLDLLIDGEGGIWHLTNGDAITWAGLAMRAAELARIGASGIKACTSAALGFVAPRPTYSALGSGRLFSMPSLDNALTRFLQHQ